MHSDYADVSYNFIMCEISKIGSIAINSIFHVSKAQVDAMFLNPVMHNVPKCNILGHYALKD